MLQCFSDLITKSSPPGSTISALAKGTLAFPKVAPRIGGLPPRDRRGARGREPPRSSCTSTSSCSARAAPTSRRSCSASGSRTRPPSSRSWPGDRRPPRPVEVPRPSAGDPGILRCAGAFPGAHFSMRTTLKRGIGRSGVSGDGNGNGTPTLPPAAVTPMSRYRQPDPPSRTQARLGSAGSCSGCSARCSCSAPRSPAGPTSTSTVRCRRVAAHTADVKIAPEAALDPAARPARDRADRRLRLSRERGEGHAVALRHGDAAARRPADEGDLDALVPARHDRPRHLPGEADLHAARSTRPTRECGARGTLETVKDLTGLPINYLITVNFHGFKQIVDKLGGVWMDVDRRYYNNNTGSAATNYADIDLHARLPAAERQRRAQLRALPAHRLGLLPRDPPADVREGAQGADPAQLLAVQAARDRRRDHEERRGRRRRRRRAHRQDRALVRALRLRPALRPLLPGEDPGADRLLQRDDVATRTSRTRSASSRRPTSRRRRRPTDVTLGRKIKSDGCRRPQKTTLLVLNGNGVTGSAATAGYQFARRGYQIVVPPSGTAGERADVRLLPLDGLLRREPARREGGGDRRSRTCSGTPTSRSSRRPIPSYGVDARRRRRPDLPRLDRARAGRRDAGAGQGKRRLRPGDVARPRPRRAAQAPVQGDGAVGDGALVRPRHWRSRTASTGSTSTGRCGSSTAPAAPSTGGSRRPTGWTRRSSPARTRRTSSSGRPYDLYYSGPHLHMVVLRWNGATYWVVNTLQDSLSNETMLAIAKGLRTYRG